MVYGISWLVDNGGEIIPLKGAVNISPTCGLLQTKTETVGCPALAEWISSPPYLSFSHCTNIGDVFSFGLFVSPNKQMHGETV